MMYEELRQEALEKSISGYSLHKIILDDNGEPIDYKFLDVNNQFEELTGLKEENIIDKKVTEVLPSIRDDFDWISVYGEVVLNGKEKEFEQYSKPLGKYFHVKVYSPKKYYFVTLIKDISNEIQIAKSSQEFLEQKGEIDYQEITDTLLDISGGKFASFFVVNEDRKSFTTFAVSGINKYLNKAEEIFGIKFKGREWDYDSDLVNKIEEKQITYFNHLYEVMETVAPKFLISKMEDFFNIGQAIILKITRQDKLLGYCTIIMDKVDQLQNEILVKMYAKEVGLFLDKKKTEKTLRHKKQELSIIYENAPVIMMLVDKKRRVRKINRGAEKLSSKTKKEMLGLRSGRALGCLHHLDDPRGCGYGEYCSHCMVRETVIETLETGKSHQMVETNLPFRVDNEEKTLTLLVSTSLLKMEKENLVLVTLLDITDRKKAETEKKQAEKKMIQSQKLESVGHLAGGIAHDFNNLLTVIQGHTQMLMDRVEKSNKIYYHIKKIFKSGKRAAELTKQLLLFSRKKDTEFKEIDLNKAIIELEKMLKRLLEENIDIKLELDDNLPQIKADKGQIEQVITNLSVNARDAMSNGGKLTITTEKLRINQQQIDDFKDIAPENTFSYR